MVCVRACRVPGARWLWAVAVLTAGSAIGVSSQAEAALYYWSDSDGGYYRPRPIARQKPHRSQVKKVEPSKKEAAKPQGPVIIAISIEKQNLKIYDANGLFAEAPVSTGMKGHSTPMGVFSVIQKQKLHHSNIYSGAPMPYMQRITWSGIAIHAGVLPGYPASHGCIRMPMSFAMKMWNWTRMGARVIVTPGEITPTSFSHPLLVAQKVVTAARSRAAGRRAARPKIRQGVRGRHADHAHHFGSKSRVEIDHRPRGRRKADHRRAAGIQIPARTDPYRRRQRCPAGLTIGDHDDRCAFSRRRRRSPRGVPNRRRAGAHDGPGSRPRGRCIEIRTSD